MAIKEKWVLQGEWDAKSIEDGAKRTDKEFSKLDATVSSFFGNIAAGIANRAISAGFNAIQSSISASTKELQTWVKEASQDAMIRGRLDATLKTLGKSFEAYAGDIKRAEDATYKLGKLTGGETQTAMLGFLQYTKDVNLAIKAIPAAVEFAGSGFTTLDGAIQKIGGTMSGFVDRDLGKMMPELKALTEEQLRSGAAIELIRAKFEGMAQANLQTTIPSFERLKATLGDLRGTLGAEADTAIAAQLNRISDALREYGRSPEAAQAAELIGQITQNGFAALAQVLGVRINGESLPDAINDVLGALESWSRTDLPQILEGIARSAGMVAGAFERLMAIAKTVSVIGAYGMTLGVAAQADLALSGMAAGGYLPGTYRGDDRMIPVAGGEYVVNPVATAKYRWLLETMNRESANPSGQGARGYEAGGEFERWRANEINRLSRNLRQNTMHTGTTQSQKYYFDEILLNLLASNASPESILATAQNNLNYQKSGMGAAIGNLNFFNTGGYWDRVKLNVSRFANLGAANAMVHGQAKASLADMIAGSGGSSGKYESNLAQRLNSPDDSIRGQAELDAYGYTNVNMYRGAYGPEPGLDYNMSVYQRGMMPLSADLIDMQKYRRDMSTTIGMNRFPGGYDPDKSWEYQRYYHSGGIIAGMGNKYAYTTGGAPVTLSGNEEIIPPTDPRHSMYRGGGGGYRASGSRQPNTGARGIATGRIAGGFQMGQGGKAAVLPTRKAALPSIIIMTGDAAAGSEIKRRLRIGSHIDLDAIDETLTAQYAN